MLPQFNAMQSDGASEPSCVIEPESSLIARAKCGDADAISALYERYAPQIQRYIASRLSDPVLAEDVCADVFVKVLESLSRYEDRGWPFSAWLYRIAYARTVDVLRQSRRRHSISLDETQLGSLEPPDEAVMTRIAYLEIKGAMGVLTSEHEGMPVSLMEAAACGVPGMDFSSPIWDRARERSRGR